MARSRDSPTNPHRAPTSLAAVPSLADALRHAATPTRICAPGSLPSRACGIAGPGVPPTLRLRGVPGGTSLDPVGTGGGAADDEESKMDGASTADQQRLLLVGGM